MKKWLCMLLAAVMLLSLTACAGTQGSTPESQTAPESSAVEPEAPHYPVTISNYNYAKEPVDITFESCPEKVLVLNQNNIETMLSLGLGDKIVAAAGLDHAVKEAYKADFEKINYLTDFTVSRESVLMLEPDMILGWWSTFGEKRLDGTDFWNERGVKTYMAENSNSIVENRTLENEYDYILDLGKIFDVEDKAQAIVDEIKDQVAQIVDQSKNLEKRTALIVEFLGDSIYTYDKTTLGGDMAITVGADLLSTPEKTIGLEDLINLDPQVIFVVYMDGDEEGMAEKSVANVTGNEALASLTAVKNGDVYAIPLGDMYTSAMRTTDGLEIFAAGLYPDLAK
ncbi:MAG: ABC transporter substrate-binding protein [Oscillospiraceae bacterium]|nr:ABC transporter substrate-binding protein [Oscillospiraceae bacterium]